MIPITENDSGSPEQEPVDEVEFARLTAGLYEKPAEEPVVGDDDVTCPVCKTHDLKAVLESDGLLFTAIEAQLNGDVDTAALLYRQFTPFDAHRAVTMLAGLSRVLQAFTGAPVQMFIDANRKQINEELAALSTPTPNTDDGSGAEGDPGA